MQSMRLPGRSTLALLGGFCFFLSALEYMVPKPLPFLRLGLANLPLLLALDILPFSSFLLLAALKIIGQALISGTLFSYVFLFSLGGTGVSAILMYVMRNGLGKEKISLVGISTAGALTSNGVQLVLAYFFVFGAGIRYAAAPILALGLITGTLLGMAGEYFIRKSQWYYRITHKDETNPEVPPAQTDRDSGEPLRGIIHNDFRKTREAFYSRTFSSADLAIAGLCMIPALLLTPDTVSRVIQLLFFWFLAWLSGKKNNPIITLSVMLGIVFFNLLVPYGEVLFSVGPLKITSGALWTGIRRAVTLEGLFMLSRCYVRQDLAFPGSFGELIGESFRFFSRLGEERNLIRVKNWIRDLDKLLLSQGEGSFPIESKAVIKKNNIGPRIILVVIVILVWLPLALRALSLLLRA